MARLQPISFAELAGWHSDEGIAAAFEAFRRSAEYSRIKPYRSGAMGADAKSFGPAFHAALNIALPLNDGAAREFFETYFQPFRIHPDPDEPPGFVTGYYEPEVAASRQRSARFSVPILSTPADLIELDEALPRPPGMPEGYRFGRKSGQGIVPYFDRKAISNGALDGQGLELFWLESRVDAFFIHVQGAARLVLPDGTFARVTYAAKSGHPFTGIGRVLADLDEIPLKQVTMQTIRAWLADNPARVDEILWKNRSYIFFRESELGRNDLGPFAAAKVQLAAERSMAVDRILHTFGTPFFISTHGVGQNPDEAFRKLMIAQDTGTAIVGPARGDLFMGTGCCAGERAGVIRHEAEFCILLPLG